ncbi:MAG: T9SS type A sorting domain-containing protein [Bacteroidetes bacterium]|nr:T9SS type A sorting domain-containing protein [Bacteroidota bacterium]
MKNTADLEDLPELSITLSPNPSKDFINVNLNQGVITEDLLSQIQVFNISGVALDVPIEATTSNDFNMNITKLPSGTYWLTLDTNRGKTREKFIVIK